MKLLFIATVLFTITTSSNKSRHSITEKIDQKQICDTVPYPPSNMQPVDPNPVNGNGTPLNKPNTPPTIPSDVYPRTDTGIYKMPDTSRKSY